MSAPSYKLSYFGITALGEPIRIVLALGGIAFEDERIAGAMWGEFKPKTPYGQMPVLQITASDGSTTQMSQARSVLRFLGKSITFEGNPLYPTDAVLAYKCDEVGEMCCSKFCTRKLKTCCL